jgi:DNA-binding NtrC family response regulator
LNEPSSRARTRLFLGPKQKRILIITHDSGLRATRAALLLAAGYAVSTAETVDQAIALLDANTFDLALIGRRSLMPGKGMDQKLRERYPKLLILKIAEIIEEASQYPTRTTISVPADVLAALKGMLP